MSITGLTQPADVVLEGPAGFKRALGATTELSGLEPGSYVLRAKAVNERDAVAPVVFVPAQAEQSIQVIAGQTTTAAVAYGADPETGYVYLVSHVDPLPSVGPLRAYVRVFRAADWKTGGLKTPLNVAEIPDCRAGHLYLDHRDRLWVHCGSRSLTVDMRRFSLQSLRTQQLPSPEVRLTMARTQRVMVDRDRHLWSWDTGTSAVGVHADTDFEADSGVAPFPAPAMGFTRTSPHQPRFFLHDGSLLGWDVATQSLGRYDASLVKSMGPVQVSTASAPTINLGGGEFVHVDETAIYVRYAQQLYEFPLAAVRGDGGSIAPTRDLRVPDGLEASVTFDSSMRYWSYAASRNTYVVLTPEQLSSDSGTVLTAAWEVSWPLVDPKEQYSLVMFYPPSYGQRYSGQ